jgi:uncharacterized cupredoxin-like copper-binding protein
MGKRLIMLAAPLVAAALVAAGCGGGDDNSSGSSGNNSNASDTGSKSSTTSTTSSAASGGGGGSTIKLGADPGGALKFDKTQLTAKAGNVTTIDFDNPSQTPHAVEVEGNGLEEKKTDTITGSSAKLTLGKLKPGKYEFYCPVPGHKQAGMKGTLTVS